MIASFLIFPSEPDGDALLAIRGKPVHRTSRGDTDALADLLVAPYALILPGQSVRAFATDLPTGLKGADRLNAARFAHEDRLAASPSDLHVVVGSGDPAPTRLIDPAILDELLSASDPHVVIADFDALAAEAGQDVRLLDRVVRPGVEGLTIDEDWYEGEAQTLSDGAIPDAVFAQLDADSSLNLRSGVYRRRTQIKTGPWMKVAAAALVCGLLGLGASLADARATSAQAAALDAEARARYQQRTGQPAPDNLSRLARQAGATSADPSAFLDLSQAMFTALADHADITVERLSYDAREGQLRLRLTYPGFEAAAALEDSFERLGTAFTPGGVREQDGTFVGDATLSLGGAS